MMKCLFIINSLVSINHFMSLNMLTFAYLFGRKNALVSTYQSPNRITTLGVVHRSTYHLNILIMIGFDSTLQKFVLISPNVYYILEFSLNFCSLGSENYASC